MIQLKPMKEIGALPYTKEVLKYLSSVCHSDSKLSDVPDQFKHLFEKVKVRQYLNKEDLRMGHILNAPTGAGKTTATIEKLKEGKHSIIVSPLNALSKQISENTNKHIDTWVKSKLITLINSDNTSEGSIDDRITLAMENKENILISFPTFAKYRELFKDVDVYVDEAHLLITFCKMQHLKELNDDIANGYFKNILLMSATPLGLSDLFGMPVHNPLLKQPYKRELELVKGKMKFASKIAFLLEKRKEAPVLTMVSNNKHQQELKSELEARGYEVLLYSSHLKEVSVENEHFNKEFDFIFCTSSLTTGVSVYGDMISVYFPEHVDTINSIPQFLARHRGISKDNLSAKSYIYANKYNDWRLKKVIKTIKESNDAEMDIYEQAHKELSKARHFIGKNMLQEILGPTYTITESEFEGDVELMDVERFVQNVSNPKEYFENNEIGHFDKGNNRFLARMYRLFELNNGAEPHKHEPHEEIFPMIMCHSRGDFWDKNEELCDNWGRRSSIYLAKKNDVVYDLDEFLGKKFEKKEFRPYILSINKIVEPTVFKNKESINAFIKPSGYGLKKVRVDAEKTEQQLVKIVV